jgi:hypothetical protein
MMAPREKEHPGDGVTLREFLLRIMDERDHRYEDRFKAQETAVSSALAAQKELTSAAFAASEKAIVKAEAAQTSYNERSNEFRGQLDDQAKLLMPRTEADARFVSFEEKLASVKTDVSSLRESRADATGKSAGLSAGWGILIACGAIAALISVGTFIFVTLRK